MLVGTTFFWCEKCFGSRKKEFSKVYREVFEVLVPTKTLLKNTSQNIFAMPV
jgi:hypothetical protein